MDYIPNVFENYLENSLPEDRQIPPSRWFVAYYRNGRGNFIHASRYLSKEIGKIPEGNLKKYGKRVLVRVGFCKRRTVHKCSLLERPHLLKTIVTLPDKCPSSPDGKTIVLFSRSPLPVGSRQAETYSLIPP
ncbi:hypothetical protein E2C01_061045 [Portunus trituberculatus]|uniref:Uncharacterized protein n=1 Tax=Portunus trituberculatus TaxID=210409 RepID=A0A5B7H463_PORTR|nr:hypothetical protein [Portunus trituberculatus]